jgi:hypothetical protein
MRQQRLDDREREREEWRANRQREEMWQQVEMGIMAAGAAMAVYAQQSYQAAAANDSLLRQVASLGDLGTAELPELKIRAQALSSELGVLPEDIAMTLYQARSLGSEDIWGDAATATRAAIAGRVTSEQALNAGMMVKNAYPDGTYSLEEVYDQLYKGIELGAFTMEQLAGGIAEVTATAGDSGTRLEDVMAMLITMTQQGATFEEAVEARRAAEVKYGFSPTHGK